MSDIKNIKYVFFDIDGVLSAPNYLDAYNNSVSGFSDEEWIEYNVRHTGTYNECVAPRIVKEFVTVCSNKYKRLYCLTADDNSFSYYNKVDFVMKNYPEFKNERDIIFTSSSLMKLDIIRSIAKRDALKLNECLLIEDTYSTILEAEKIGISTMHISHLLDWEG